MSALIVAAVLVACAAAVLAVSREAEATFPGKNGKIAYVAFRYTNGTVEIYTINPGGGGKTQITHNNKADYDPDYSPDGKRIVYEGSDTFGDLDVDKAESDIYTIKAGGGDKTHVTNTDKVDEFEPSYSPDGKKIAYTLYKGNAIEIYTIDVGGGGKTNLTNTDNVDEEMPSWGSRP
jgi:TolB protein